MSSTPVVSTDRRASFPLTVGLLATVALLAAFAMDQWNWGTIEDQIVAPGGEIKDVGPLFAFQYIAGGFGVVAWIVSLWGVLGRKDWVRTFATGAFMCGLAVAAYTLLARGFSGIGFPTFWGLLLLVPCIPGGIAVLMLWRRPAPTAGIWDR